MAFVTTEYADRIGMGLGQVKGRTTGVKGGSASRKGPLNLTGKVMPKTLPSVAAAMTKTAPVPEEAALVEEEAALVEEPAAEDQTKKILLYAGGGLAVLAVLYYMTR